ncbi:MULTISPECIES: hypothetical protein [Nostocales]|nr:hypothetical protein [Tolypothrix bouteillei]
MGNNSRERSAIQNAYLILRYAARYHRLSRKYYALSARDSSLG